MIDQNCEVCKGTGFLCVSCGSSTKDEACEERDHPAKTGCDNCNEGA